MLSVSVKGLIHYCDFDETRMRQIVTNLVENALTHTPKYGAVHVMIEQSHADLKITVTDSGAGIEQSDLPRIFDRFYRTDDSRTRSTGGAGLGLTIVKRLTEAHGGHVQVQSTPGHGSIFTVILPII